MYFEYSEKRRKNPTVKPTCKKVLAYNLTSADEETINTGVNHS